MSVDYATYIGSEEWQIVRRWALERAEGACQVCMSRDSLEVHHRSYERLGREAPADLIVLCEVCHGLFHQRMTSQPLPHNGPVGVLDALRALGVPTRKYGDATFESFDDSDSPLALRAAVEMASSTVAAQHHDRVRGLYLVGESGVGKSHLAAAIMRHVLEHAAEKSVAYDSADRLIVKIQDSYSRGGVGALIEHRAAADLYVLDDLGREKPTTDALRVLVTILDEREGAPTVITSNYVPNDLGKRHGNMGDWGRVHSRLGDDVYRYVRIVGHDRRFRERTA